MKPSKPQLLARVATSALRREEKAAEKKAADDDHYDDIVAALKGGCDSAEVAVAARVSTQHVRAIRRAHKIEPAPPGRRPAARA